MRTSIEVLKKIKASDDKYELSVKVSDKKLNTYHIPVLLGNNDVRYKPDFNTKVVSADTVIIFYNRITESNNYPQKIVLKAFSDGKESHLFFRETMVLPSFHRDKNERICNGVILDEYVLMEYFEGNLYNLMNMFINEGKRISGLSIFCIISEIRLILDYLESINLINVDIKLENFVYEYNSDLDIYKVVMIDYSSLLPINCVSYKFSTYPRFKDEFAYEKIADKKDHYYGLFVIGLRLLYSNCLDLEDDYNYIFNQLTYIRFKDNGIDYNNEQIITTISDINTFLDNINITYHYTETCIVEFIKTLLTFSYFD